MDRRTVYVASDGDGIGNQVARAGLADDEDMLHDISERIESGNELIRSFVVEHGGRVISSGGDECDFSIPVEAVVDLESLRVDYNYMVGATLSLGVGELLSQAGKALDVAKLNGKDQIVQYTSEVEEQWQKGSQQINSDPAAAEAEKIGKAHMKNDKKPTNQVVKDDDMQANSAPDKEDEQQSDQADEQQNDRQKEQDEHDDCPYCDDAQDELGEDDCPYCADDQVGEADAQVGDAADDGLGDCPYCDEAHSEDQHSHDDNCPHCQELDNAEGSENDPRLNATDEQTGDNSENPSPMEEDSSSNEQDPQGDSEDEPKESGSEEHQTPEEVMEEFDEQHGEPSQEDDSKYDETDDTGIAEAGDGQEENISRPDDFNEEIPQGSEDPNNTDGSGDTSDGSQDPNYSEVMSQDLSNNQDDIQKEQVRNIVGQALQAFKASKGYLEQAQQQSPEFYQANIGMIRAMIEMAKMLGFSGPAQGQDAVNGQPSDGQQGELGSQEAAMIGQQESAQPNPADPFPKHVENGGSPKDSESAGDKPDPANPFPQHPDHGGDSGKKPKGQ